MAKNRKTGGRIGAVRGRTQFQLPNGHYAKRDARTGEILSVKADLKPYKGIVKEKPAPQAPAKPTVRITFPRLGAWEWGVRRQTHRYANQPITKEPDHVQQG
jgi:hypothetical protein